MSIFQKVGSFFEDLASGVADVVKAVASAFWSAVSAVLGAFFGSFLCLIYYGFMNLVNFFKPHDALSSCLKSVLKIDFPSVKLDEVRIVQDAVAPTDKRAMTEGYTIYFRDRFSEDKGDDLSDLMHELVHVRQYEAHGKWVFMVLYIWGYVNEGFSYEDIPMEREARDFVSSHFPQFERSYQANCNQAYVPVSDLIPIGDWVWLYW